MQIATVISEMNVIAFSLYIVTLPSKTCSASATSLANIILK